MATKKDTAQAAPATAPIASNGDGEEMSEWQGKFGGNVDGWFAPPDADHDHKITGILSNFISKDRSDKLQSNTLVFELTEACDGVKNGGSEKIPGAKGDNKLHKAGAGCMIGVPEWRQLEGMWPSKAGHKVTITRSGHKRAIGKGRSMYDIKVQMSNKVVKEIEVFEEEAIDTSDAAGGGMAPGESFQVEAS